MQTIVRRALLGVVAGAIATVPMTGVMLAAQRMGLLGESPPRLVTDFAFLTARLPIHDKTEELVATGSVHFGFGSVCGAIFGILTRGGSTCTRMAQGMAFGFTIWFVSYQGWIPALHIMPDPEDDRPDRPIVMILAHLVYGSVLGLIISRMVDRR